MLLLILTSCASGGYMNTVEKLDLERFMGEWFVIAGRTTYFEKGAYNSLEHYKWNKSRKRIDITFTYNKNALDGPKKTIKQKAWLKDKESNSFWSVQPFWPLKFDYIIMEIDPDYQWTAVGVPNQSYLWIMSRSKHMEADVLKKIISTLKSKDYDTANIQIIEHSK